MRSYKKREKKKEKRNQIIIAVVLSFIMIGSMAGIMLNNRNTNEEYNDHKFKITQNGYLTEVNNKEFYFQYLPQDIEQFKLSKSFSEKLRTSEVIQILFEPDTQSAQFIDYIRFNLDENLNQEIISRVTNESSSYSAFEVASCENASIGMPMIFFKEAEDNSSVTENNNCLVIESNQNNFLIFRDVILYAYTGIMPGE